MPDLTTSSVAQYTSDRLDKSAADTRRWLSAGQTAARRFCGWPVTLVEDDVVTMDGPGSALLVLPTLRLVELKSVVENGIDLDVETELYVSDRGLVRKRSGARWSGNYGSVVVTMTHGFEDADDFNAAVLSWIDRMSLTAAGGRAKVIGPFQYDTEAMAAGSAFSVVEKSLLEQYRLESPA